MPVMYLSIPVPVNPVADALPAVLGSCTGLYAAVRRIGGAGAGAHVHIVDRASAVRLV